MTNNSTKSRKGYKGKFTSLGLEVEPEEIFSSSFAAAAYLEQTKFKESGKKVYIVGEVGIQEELDLIGVPYIGALYLAPPAPTPARAARAARAAPDVAWRVARAALGAPPACACAWAERTPAWLYTYYGAPTQHTYYGEYSCCTYCRRRG